MSVKIYMSWQFGVGLIGFTFLIVALMASLVMFILWSIPEGAPYFILRMYFVGVGLLAPLSIKLWRKSHA